MKKNSVTRSASLALALKKNQDEVHSKLGCIDTPVGQLSVAHTRDCITNWE